MVGKNPRNMSGYRYLKTGEIVKKGDEYISSIVPLFFPVAQCTIGQPILECNARYYRRKRGQS